MHSTPGDTHDSFMDSHGDPLMVSIIITKKKKRINTYTNKLRGAGTIFGCFAYLVITQSSMCIFSYFKS